MFCGHQCLLTFSPETAKKFSENAKKSQKSAWNVQSNTELRSPCCKNCKDVKRCDIHATLRRRVVDEIRWENWEIVITAITQIMARDTRNYHKTREIDVFIASFAIVSHCSKSQIFVQKFNFDNNPIFSRVFHPFFWQFFSWNKSCQKLKLPKPQHFHVFLTQ